MSSFGDITEMDTEEVALIKDKIRLQLEAFPGVTIAMLHPRLTPKYKKWRSVFEELLMSRQIRREHDVVDGSSITRHFWAEDDAE